MTVYVVMRYWDNDEQYPEDFYHHEEPVKVFKSIEAAVNYLNALTVTDILGSECKGEDGWYLDESEGIQEDRYGSKYRTFHARTPGKDDEIYYESANIIFSTAEVEMEVAKWR